MAPRSSSVGRAGRRLALLRPRPVDQRYRCRCVSSIALLRSCRRDGRFCTGPPARRTALGSAPVDLDAALQRSSASRPSARASARRARRRSAGATCWWSCPRAPASRSATSCRRCCATTSTIVVSPLVALMQDQVEALAARGPGRRVALVNAQQDAAANARRASARAAAGELRLLYVAPERFSSPGLRRARCARRGSACSWSTRRTACRSGATTSGPTTSAWPTPRATSARRPLVASTATATPRGGRRHRAPARPARPGAGVHRLRPAQPRLRRRAARPPHEKRAADRRGAARAGRAAGHRLRGHARGQRGDRRRAVAGELGERGAGLPRRPRRAACAPRSAPLPGRRACGSSWPPTRSAWASTRPTCAPSCTPASPRRSRPTTRRPAAPGATALPARCAAAGREPRQGAARALHRARQESTSACSAALAAAWSGAPTATGATTSTPASSRGGSACDGDRLRALIGHLARAGVVAALARVAGPGARAGSPAPSTGAPARLPHLGRGGRAGALAPVPRGLGARRGAEACRRGRDPAPLRRSPQPPPSVPLLRRVRSRPGAGRPAPATAAARPRRRRRRRRPALDDAIIDSGRASPAVGRTPAAEILHGGRTQEDQAVLLRRAAAATGPSRTCAAPTSWRAWTS